MRKSEKLFCFFVLSGLSIVALPAHATVIQYFFGSNYKNPAELSTIPRAEVSAGVTGINPVMKFKGVSGGGSGTATTDETDALPYFYGAFRLDPQWVVGLNISRPFYGDQKYSENSIVSYESTQTLMHNVDINPQISYQVTKQLAIGAGYNFNDFYDTQLNFVEPGLGNVENKSSGWYHGWDVGLFYTLTPQDYLSLSYFSALSATTQTGTSRVGATINNNYALAGAFTPATTLVNYIHIFNQQWSSSIQVGYSQWHSIQNLVLTNVANYGTLALPLHYRNTYSAQAGARYAFAPGWAALGGVGFDEGASNDFTRSITFPNDDAYAAALGLEHQFCKDLIARLMYTYITADTRVNHSLGFSPSVGDIDLHANVVDFNLTYKI